MPAKGETNTKGKKDAGGMGIRDYEEIGRGGGGERRRSVCLGIRLDWIIMVGIIHRSSRNAVNC